MLHSRSGCLQIQTLSAAALLPITLNTVYDKSLLIPYYSQHLESIYNDPPPMQKKVEKKGGKKKEMSRVDVKKEITKKHE